MLNRIAGQPCRFLKCQHITRLVADGALKLLGDTLKDGRLHTGTPLAEPTCLGPPVSGEIPQLGHIPRLWFPPLLYFGYPDRISLMLCGNVVLWGRRNGGRGVYAKRCPPGISLGGQKCCAYKLRFIAIWPCA